MFHNTHCELVIMTCIMMRSLQPALSLTTEADKGRSPTHMSDPHWGGGWQPLSCTNLVLSED